MSPAEWMIIENDYRLRALRAEVDGDRRARLAVVERPPLRARIAAILRSLAARLDEQCLPLPERGRAPAR